MKFTRFAFNAQCWNEVLFLSPCLSLSHCFYCNCSRRQKPKNKNRTKKDDLIFNDKSLNVCCHSGENCVIGTNYNEIYYIFYLFRAHTLTHTAQLTQDSCALAEPRAQQNYSIKITNSIFRSETIEFYQCNRMCHWHCVCRYDQQLEYE